MNLVSIFIFIAFQTDFLSPIKFKKERLDISSLFAPDTSIIVEHIPYRILKTNLGILTGSDKNICPQFIFRLITGEKFYFHFGNSFILKRKKYQDEIEFLLVYDKIKYGAGIGGWGQFDDESKFIKDFQIELHLCKIRKNFLFLKIRIGKIKQTIEFLVRKPFTLSLIYTNNPKDKLLYKQNAELIGFIYPKTFLGICFSKKDTLLYGGAIFGYNNFYLKMIGRKSYYEAEFGYTIKKWF